MLEDVDRSKCMQILSHLRHHCQKAFCMLLPATFSFVKCSFCVLVKDLCLSCQTLMDFAL